MSLLSDYFFVFHHFLYSPNQFLMSIVFTPVFLIFHIIIFTVMIFLYSPFGGSALRFSFYFFRHPSLSFLSNGN